jgi:hypothetical protein
VWRVGWGEGARDEGLRGGGGGGESERERPILFAFGGTFFRSMILALALCDTFAVAVWLTFVGP